MSLTVKIVLAAALILSIAVPFGAFAAGEKTRGRYKTALGVNALLFFGTLITASVLMFSGQAYAAGEAAESAVNSISWLCTLSLPSRYGIHCCRPLNRTFRHRRRYRCFRRCFGSFGSHQRGLHYFRKIAHLRRTCRRCLPLRTDHLLHDPR